VNTLNDSEFQTLSALVDGLAGTIEQMSDPRQGMALTVEDLAVTLPLEMRIEVDENETVRLATASPWRTETSFEPVLHSLSIRVVLDNGA
jgi:hypothetical protein